MDAKTEARTLSFMVLSSITHTALAVAVMTLNVQSEPKPEMVQVEIVSSGREMPAQAPTVSEVEKVVAPLSRPVAVIQKTANPVPTPVPASKALSAPVAKSLPAKMAQRETPTQEDSPVVLPVVKEDLQETHNIDKSEVSTEAVNEDLSQDMDQIDEQENSKLVAVNAKIQKETDEELKAQEEKIAILQEKNKLESEKLAQENAEKRAQERAALVAAQEAERAQAAAEGAAAEAQKQSSIAAAGSSGKNGSVGNGEDVRSIEDLKQMPGNTRPQYDRDDRLNGRQGDVAFLAYVSKDGLLTQFKMLKSTGHRELDGKTLQALKTWKFYPKQEGWVEIPFRWDLKGGAQPLGPILRTKKSASL